MPSAFGYGYGPHQYPCCWYHLSIPVGDAPWPWPLAWRWCNEGIPNLAARAHASNQDAPPSALQCIVIPFATNLYVREVGAFTFCVGLAWLARCVLPHKSRRKRKADNPNDFALVPNRNDETLIQWTIADATDHTHENKNDNKNTNKNITK